MFVYTGYVFNLKITTSYGKQYCSAQVRGPEKDKKSFRLGVLKPDEIKKLVFDGPSTFRAKSGLLHKKA